MPSSQSSKLQALLSEHLERLRSSSPHQRDRLLEQLIIELESLGPDTHGAVEPTLPLPESGGMLAPTVSLDAEHPRYHTASWETVTQRLSEGTPVVWGNYRLMRELARGGMGVVFEAQQLSLNRRVALKMILAGQLASNEHVRRFKAEAEAAAQLDHPGIARVFEVGELQGRHFFSMELVEGGSLGQRLLGGPLPATEAAALVRRVAEAVEYAHQQGVIHRDLKPSNVLLDNDGQPHVTDFGLAKRQEIDSQLTQTGQILGTPSYMPPEQAAGSADQVGPAADVYSLGALLYAALTGRPPFQAPTLAETLGQVQHAAPVAPRQLNHRIPKDLETICLKCLRKEPAQRYASAQALAADLARWEQGLPIEARPTGRLEKAAKWARRHPAAAALLATVLAAAGVFTGMTLRHQQQLGDALEAAVDEKNATARESKLRQRSLFAARMNLAQRAWDAGQVDQVLGYLDSLRPQAGEDDLRSFGWRHLWHVTHQDLMSLHGHESIVSAVAVSPDGTLLASADSYNAMREEPGRIQVWRLPGGEPHATFEDEAGSVASLLFLPDGRLLTGNQVGDLSIYDLDAKSRVAREPTGLVTPLRAVALSPDGRHLFTPGRDGALIAPLTLFKWRLPDLKRMEVLSLKQPNVAAISTIGSLAFSEDGRRLCAAAHQQLLLYDLEMKAVVENFQRQGELFTSATVHGSRIVAGTIGGRVLVFDIVQPGKADVATFNGHSGGVTHVRFDASGKRLLTVGGDAAIRVWDTQGFQLIASLYGHTGNTICLALDEENGWLASGGGSAQDPGEVKLWSWPPAVQTHQPLAFERGIRLNSAVLCDDADTVLAANLLDNKLRRALTRDRSVQATLDAPASVEVCLARNADIAAFVSDKQVRLLDAKTLEVQSRPLPMTVSYQAKLAIRPDGQRVAVGDGERIAIWSRDGGRIASATLPDQVTALCYAEENLLLAGAANGDVQLLNAESGEPLRKWTHPDLVGKLKYLPSQSLFACALREGEVHLHPLGEGEPRVLHGHSTLVEAIALSPDDKLLATGGSDNSVRLWDLRTGLQRLTLPGKPERVLDLQFRSDGLLLVGIDDKGVIRHWQASARGR